MKVWWWEGGKRTGVGDGASGVRELRGVEDRRKSVDRS